jgi:peptidoglycan/xylan/chitin deacetylase (PgdA/CDA1 family)
VSRRSIVKNITLIAGLFLVFLFACPLVSASYVTDSLIVDYDFNNTVGGVVPDLATSDATNNGNINSGTLYQLSNGAYAVHLDGTNTNYINIASMLTGDYTEFTIEIWYYYNGSTTQQCLYDLGYDADYRRAAGYINDTQITQAKVSSISLLSNKPIVSKGRWIQYVYTFKSDIGNRDYMYINGLPFTNTGTHSVANPFTLTASTAQRFGLTMGGGSPLSSSISRIRLYGKQLSAAEVLQNFDNDKWRTIETPSYISNGLEVYYDPANVYGTTLIDIEASGGANDATLNSATQYQLGSTAYAIALTGDSGSYIGTSTKLNTTYPEYSIEAWYYVNGTGTQCLYDMGTDTDYKRTTTTLDKTKIVAATSTGIAAIYNQTLNSAGHWIQYVYTYKNGTDNRAYIYINGNLLSNTSTFGSDHTLDLTTSTAQNIGVKISGGYNPFNGSIMLYRFYSRQLSNSEVAQNFNNDVWRTETYTVDFTKASYNASIRSTPYVRVTVKRANTSTTGSVEYNTIDGTAITGVDYSATTGTLNFDVGEETKTISIPIVTSNIYVSTPKYFYITISDPTVDTLGYYTNSTVYIKMPGGIAMTFDTYPFQAINYYGNRSLLTEHGAKETFMIEQWDDWTDLQKSYMYALASDGHELGDHTLNHVNAPEYVAANGLQAYLDNEIIAHKTVLAADGVYPTSFAYPGGSYTAQIQTALESYYWITRGAEGSGIQHNRANLSDDSFYTFGSGARIIDGLNTDMISNTSMSELQYAMDRAGENGECLVLYGHYLRDYSEDGYYTPPSRLDAIFDYADSIGLEFYTLSELTGMDNVNYTISASNNDISEADTSITLTITKNRTSYHYTTININTTDESAIHEIDYTAINQILEFTPAELTKIVVLSIKENSHTTSPKTFTVALSSPTGNATLGTPYTITITINPNAKDVMGAKNNTPKILAMFGLMFIIPIIIAVGLIITMMATREVNPIILVGAVIGIGLFFIVLIVMMVLAGDIMAIVNP